MAAFLGDLARLIGAELHGDPRLSIERPAILRDACPGDITLADHPRLAAQLHACKASAVLVGPSFPPPPIAYLVVNDVHQAFARVVEHFRPRRASSVCGISPAAHVSPTASVDPGVVVYPGATIGDEVRIGAGTVIFPGVHVLAGCRIGAHVTIFPNAVLYENTLIGDRVVIHASVVLGAYGFGYQTQHGAHHRSAQLGYVEVGDDVEIGAGTTIDRGTYGATVIGEGTKIDNLVMIAHNCRIGRHNLICSQVGVAGSSTTGDYVVMAGQVGLRDHIHIGDRAVLGAKAGVMNDVPADQTYEGIPATAEREQMLKQVAWSKLPELRKEFKELQKRVAELESRPRTEAA